MLTDDEARRLLQHAGETVRVDPAAPFDPQRRAPWPVLVAAAAVVAIAVVSVAVANRGGSSGPDPAPAPAGPETVQIPSVLGYEQAEAIQALTDAGFIVSSAPVGGCDPSGVALRTTPAAGTSLAPGAEVRIDVVGVVGYCDSEGSVLATELLAFADGRGAAPMLADTVQISDAAGTAEITAARAADPETWRTCSGDEVCTSVLARLSQAAHRFYPLQANGRARYESPYLSTAPPAPCTFAPPPTGLGQPTHQLGVATLVDGDFCTQDFVLDIDQDRRGAITSVALREQQPGAPSSPTDPTEELAHQVDAFARGDGPLPPMAEQVDLYLGNAFTGFVTQESAQDRQAWETCTEIGSYAGASCPLSPLDVLKSHRQVEYVDLPQGLCMPTYGPLPPKLREADRITIVPAEGSIDSCMQNFAVQLFTNDDGELIAVSLLHGEP